MARPAASARALLQDSPSASGESTPIEEHIRLWLKTTVVLLLVILLATQMISRCIKNIAAWRVRNEDGGGSAREELPGEVRSDSPRTISINEAAQDLETGMELAQGIC